MWVKYPIDLTKCLHDDDDPIVSGYGQLVVQNPAGRKCRVRHDDGQAKGTASKFSKHRNP